MMQCTIMIPATTYVQAGTFHDLYWAMGDSGNQFDKSLKAQDPNELHGSIMRISVNSNMGVDYEIPDGNPFQNGGAFGESTLLLPTSQQLNLDPFFAGRVTPT